LPADLCPWLGTKEDRRTRHTEPIELHLCYAQKRPAGIELDHQARLCLTNEHQACQFYLEPPPPPAPEPLQAAEDEVGPPLSRFSALRALLWIVAALVAAAVVYYYGSALLAPAPGPTPTTGVSPSSSATPTHTLTPAPGTAEGPAPLPVETPTLPNPEYRQPTATPTPYPGGAIYSLSPPAGAAGWLASNEARGNHLGDSYLYAGVFDSIIYHGVFQFDLQSVPRGATIHAAILEITGLNARRLGESGAWELRGLVREADENWSRHTFQDVHNAAVQWTLPPALGINNLAVGESNTFELSQEQLHDLEQRLLDEHYTVSFRLDGPLAGENSVFAWDGGYGLSTQGRGPRLLLNVGPPPKTPIPTGPPPPTGSPEWFVVTSTPTPGNAVTAAAVAAQVTAWATTTGTPTPLPQFVATPTPRYILITNTPSPANSATAVHLQALATANTLLTGTPTPTPPNLATVEWFIVTASPTPENIMTAAAIAMQKTAWATTTGTPTSLPTFVVTATPRYIVVTRTPTPINQATAEYLQSLATAQVVLTGTPTPTPYNLATATFTPGPTWTPVFIWLDELAGTTTPTVTPTPTMPPIPAILQGRILFLSDRGEKGAVYMMDLPSGRLAVLTASWPYDLALQAKNVSPDGRAWAYVQNDGRKVPQVYIESDYYRGSWQVTFNKGINYHPAWSPLGDQLAFVSTESGNDEIYVIGTDGKNQRQLTFNQWEWDKHPTWSPDGRLIAFWSNQGSGRRQLWIMNADGSNRRILLDSLYNDWDPVWVKW
jgi:hypothetical protein